MLTFEESSKDVQEAEEEIPVAATEEMLEAEEEKEEKKDNKEEKPREEEKEGGEGDDEGGAEELQWLLPSTQQTVFLKTRPKWPDALRGKFFWDNLVGGDLPCHPGLWFQ